MPFHAATLIVDAFFLDGAAVIFRVALAILRENESKLLACRDEGEIMLLLSGFMESVYSREAAPKSQQTAPKDVLHSRSGTGPEITNLVRSAYQHYSLVTSDQIEKMRMDERLKVVRGLEDNTMRSACRRVSSDLKTSEIVSLYKLIREEAMSRRYHGQQIKDALFNPDQPPEKQFRVDRSLWVSLFKDLVPFGKAAVGETLAGRIWKLLAKDQDGLATFEEVVTAFGELCRGDSAARLRVIARAQQPPAFDPPVTMNKEDTEKYMLISQSEIPTNRDAELTDSIDLVGKVEVSGKLLTNSATEDYFPEHGEGDVPRQSLRFLAAEVSCDKV